MRHIRHAAHVVYATLAIHLSVLASDRWKDAYADVGLDHAMQGIEHVIFDNNGSK